jgi:hypothetical protein
MVGKEGSNLCMDAMVKNVTPGMFLKERKPDY